MSTRNCGHSNSAATEQRSSRSCAACSASTDVRPIGERCGEQSRARQCQLNSRLHRPVIKWLSFGSRPRQKNSQPPQKMLPSFAAKPVLKPARHRKAPGRCPHAARNLPGHHSAITNGSCYGCRRKLWPQKNCSAKIASRRGEDAHAHLRMGVTFIPGIPRGPKPSAMSFQGRDGTGQSANMRPMQKLAYWASRLRTAS